MEYFDIFEISIVSLLLMSKTFTVKIIDKINQKMVRYRKQSLRLELL